MADELDPVVQKFEADLTDYVEPIKAAAEETQGFADVVDETIGSLDSLAGSMDDAGASAEGLAESEKSFRDAVYEANPGIDDQTASLLADAAAAEAAGLSMDELAASERVAGRDAQGLHNTLTELRDILGAAALGDSLQVTKAGMNDFRIVTDEETASLHGLRDIENDTRQAIIETDEMMTAARASADAYRDSIDKLRLSVVSMYEGVDAEKALADADSAGGGFLPKVLGALGGSGGFGAILGNFAALGAGMFVVAPLIAAIASGLVVLASGFSAAAIGVASFVAFAVPGLKQVYDVLTGVNKASTLTGIGKQMYEGIEGLKKEFDGLEKSVAPGEMRVFNQVIANTGPLLKDVAIFAEAASGPLDKLAVEFGKAVSSPAFAKGVQQLLPYIKDSIPAIAHGLWEVGVAFSNLFTVFSAPTVAKGITGFFDMIRDIVNALGALIGGGTIRSIDLFGVHLHDLDISMYGWKNNWNSFSGSIAEAGRNIERWGRDAARIWLEAFGQMEGGLQTLKDAFDHFNNAIDEGRHDIAQWAGDAISWVHQVYTSVTNWITNTITSLTTHWDNGWNDVVSFVKSIPGRIVAALGDLGSLLIGAGEHLISGLITGLKDMLGPLGSFLGGIAGFIASHKGPIETDRQLLVPHGAAMIDGLIAGMESRKAALAAALAGLTGTISGGAAGNSTLNIRVAGAAGASGAAVAAAVASDPHVLQQFQQVAQEAALRYTHLNQGTGVFLPGRRS